MADNVTANPGTGGPTFATDQKPDNSHVPAMKLELGADGTFDGYVSSTNPLPITGGGSVAAGNSTTDTLLGGQSYEGSWDDVTAFGSISIIAATDVAGTLFGEFSIDGVSTDRSLQLSPGDAAISAIHTLIPVSQYFRVRVVNGAAGQGSFRMQTLYHPTARIAQPTSRIYQSLGSYQDVLNVRIGNQPQLDAARGLVGGQMVVHKFGINPDVSATEDVTGLGGTINWPQAATAVRIASGGNPADDATGNNARKITVEGLDENWDVATEDIVTAGASQSSATTTTFTRVYRAFITDVGGYTAANAGNITVETTGGVSLIQIEAGKGQSETTQYTVPAGKTAYLTRVGAGVDGGVGANRYAAVQMFQRQNADDVSVPFTGKRLVMEFVNLATVAERKYESFIAFPEKTDLWFTAIGNNGPGVRADYDLILIDN